MLREVTDEFLSRAFQVGAATARVRTSTQTRPDGKNTELFSTTLHIAREMTREYGKLS